MIIQHINHAQCLPALKEAFSLFNKSKVSWICIFLVYVVLTSIVGYLSSLFAVFLTSFLLAGVASASKAVDGGLKVGEGFLFRGFKQHKASLFIFTIFSILLTVALVMGMSSIVGYFSKATYADVSISSIAGSLSFVGILLTLIYAPTLIILNNINPFKATIMSISAWLKNPIYSIAYSLILATLISASLVTAGLGFIVFGPVIFISLYTSYKLLFKREVILPEVPYKI